MTNEVQTIHRQDVYSRITSQIVASLEKGTRPWVKPWNSEHAAGRITRPLRHNGQPYSGINILSLWMSAELQGFAAPIWMTFHQALELDAHVRKGEKGSLVVYANTITRTEHDDNTGGASIPRKKAGRYRPHQMAAPGSNSSALPVMTRGVVIALLSVSVAFWGRTVALMVSPSTRQTVSISLRLRSRGISSLNMVLPRLLCGLEKQPG